MQPRFFLRSAIVAVVILATGCSVVTSQVDTGQASRVSGELLDLFNQFTEYIESGKPAEEFEPTDTGLRLDSGSVLIDATSDTSGIILMEELEGLGLKGGASVGRVVSGWFPVASIGELDRVEHLKFVRASGVSTGAG
jgi:hypothetical protein